MKLILFSLVFFLAQFNLQAAEEILTHIKITYQAANGGPPVEAETEAFGGSGSEAARVPLKFPGDATWIVQLATSIEENLLYAQILDAAKVTAADSNQRDGLNFLSFKTQLKLGADIVLVKNSEYKITVNISKVPVVEKPDAPKIPENKPDPVLLTAAEVAKLDLSFSNNSGGTISIYGHNPFSKAVVGGLLEVTIPKTDSTPEIKREYAFSLVANPLADLSAGVRTNLPLSSGPKPTYSIQKLQFQP